MYSFQRKQYVAQAKPQEKTLQVHDKKLVGDLEILERILTFGATGTYYVNREDHQKEAFGTIEKIGKFYRENALMFIAEFSKSGRAASNDHAIAALAVLYPQGENATDSYRQAYREAFFDVIRIPTHLFLWVKYTKQMRSFGRYARKLISDWYNKQNAYLLLKYQGRYKWTHSDVWRLSHPKLLGEAKQFADWEKGVKSDNFPEIIEVYKEMLAAKSVDDVCALIKKHQLTHEFVPTVWHKEKKVWEALLPNLPTMALIRNLNKYAFHEIPIGDLVRTRLCDHNVLRKAKIHPLQILVALSTYQSGGGYKGNMMWVPENNVSNALDDAFQMSFHAADPIGKSIVVALDVSGSMNASVGNDFPLTCAMAGAALAMYFVRREQDVYVMGYSDDLVPLPYKKTTELKTAISIANNMTFGSTNCALPFAWANKTRILIDCFISITDNETNAYQWGQRKTSSTQTELNLYRQRVNPKARSIVLAMTSGNFSIHDQNDMKALDIAGFDASIGTTINNFFDK